MERLGVSLYDWQRRVLSDWLAIEEDGTYVHYRNGLEVPRQNGKTALLEARIVPGAVLKGETFAYTAHDYSTVQMLFDRLQGYFGEKANDPEAKHPDLNRLVKSVRKAVSKEAIFLKNGAAIYLATRTKSSKLGFTADVFIADEAQELSNEHSEALLSTVSSAPLGNPQYIMCGTPPVPSSRGDVFAHIRREAQSGSTQDVGWNEWSVDSLDAIDDPATWYRVNPSLGLRVLESAVRAELGTYTDPLSFAQMRLGYFLPNARKEPPVIDWDTWKSCKLRQVQPITGEEVPCFAVKFSIDGARATIAAALKLDGGRVLVDVPSGCNRSVKRGIGWVVQWLKAVAPNAAEIWIDGKAHAEDLKERLIEEGVSKKCLKLPTSPEFVAACSMFTNAASERTLAHLGQEPVTYAMDNTKKRKIGNGGGFGFEAVTEQADETLPEALALAYTAVKTTKRNPKRKARIG